MWKIAHVLIDENKKQQRRETKKISKNSVITVTGKKNYSTNFKLLQKDIYEKDCMHFTHKEL